MLNDIGIGRKRILRSCVFEDHGFSGAHYVSDERLGQRGCGETGVYQTHSDTFPLVVASASTRSSSLRRPIRSPRSAPACSMAARMTLSIRFSRTSSPETACDTLITVA